MNEFDKIALAKFNPSNGDYLVVKGKGEYQHLECKHLRGSKIPFLGRILQKIVYPSFRFKKVVDYVFKPEQLFEDIEIQSLKDKTSEYFRLDDQGEATRHKKLWGSVNDSYHKALDIEHLMEQEAAEPQRQIMYFTDWGQSEAKICELPSDIMQQLPANENYIVTSTSDTARPQNTFNIFVEQHLEPHVRTLEKPPIILVISFGEFSGRYFRESLESIEKLKTKKLIRDYCPIYRAGTMAMGADDWKKTKDQNNASIKLLVERLGQ